MLGRIINFIVGKASFEIFIRDPREITVLNLLKKQGFYDCEASEGKITLSCGCGDVKTISEKLREMQLDYKLRTAGLWYLLKNFFLRGGLICAAVLCLILDAVFSDTLWRIDVIGNQTIPEREIREALYSFGVYEGCRKSDIDIKQLTIDYMLLDDRVSFAHLNINGTTAVMEISEREVPPERQPDKKDVCNIVAKCDGVISRIDVYSGGKEVENGDSVLKGQLLISSFFETRTVGYILRRAKGTVFAETSPVFEMRIPKETYIKTGKTEHEKKSLKVLGFVLPIDGGNIALKGKNAELDTESRQLSLFGTISLPVSLVTDRYTVENIEESKRDKESAEKIFQEHYIKWKNEYLKDAEILSEENEFKEEDDCYIFAVRLSCIENIGIDKPFEIREN